MDAHLHDHGDRRPSGDAHGHGVSPNADRKYLTLAFLLIVAFMAFEVVVGLLAHSLALLSDAGHMLTDAAALALSLAVIRYVQQPGGEVLTYGRRRAEVLSGQASGALLLVLGLLVTYESISRLITPPVVRGMAVTIVAAVGIVMNVFAAWLVAKANRQNLNIEGSFQHIVTDLYAFIGTFVAGLVIIFTGFNRADAIASLAVAGLMFRSGFDLQRKSIRVLLEGAPEGMPPSEVGEAMVRGELVKEVHDLHLWELAPGHPILTAHVLVAADADCHAVRRALERLLKDRFDIDHTTLQVEHVQDRLLSVGRRGVEGGCKEWRSNS
jgi:cobalt-zinc-cadmium efflux system protein